MQINEYIISPKVVKKLLSGITSICVYSFYYFLGFAVKSELITGTANENAIACQSKLPVSVAVEKIACACGSQIVIASINAENNTAKINFQLEKYRTLKIVPCSDLHSNT